MLRTKEEFVEYIEKYWPSGTRFYIPLVWSQEGINEDLANALDDESTELTEAEFEVWADRMDNADWSWAYENSVVVAEGLINERGIN